MPGLQTCATTPAPTLTLILHVGLEFLSLLCTCLRHLGVVPSHQQKLHEARVLAMLTRKSLMFNQAPASPTPADPHN